MGYGSGVTPGMTGQDLATSILNGVFNDYVSNRDAKRDHENTMARDKQRWQYEYDTEAMKQGALNERTKYIQDETTNRTGMTNDHNKEEMREEFAQLMFAFSVKSLAEGDTDYDLTDIMSASGRDINELPFWRNVIENLRQSRRKNQEIESTKAKRMGSGGGSGALRPPSASEMMGEIETLIGPGWDKSVYDEAMTQLIGDPNDPDAKSYIDPRTGRITQEGIDKTLDWYYDNSNAFKNDPIWASKQTEEVAKVLQADESLMRLIDEIGISASDVAGYQLKSRPNTIDPTEAAIELAASRIYENNTEMQSNAPDGEVDIGLVNDALRHNKLSPVDPEENSTVIEVIKDILMYQRHKVATPEDPTGSQKIGQIFNDVFSVGAYSTGGEDAGELPADDRLLKTERRKAQPRGKTLVEHLRDAPEAVRGVVDDLKYESDFSERPTEQDIKDRKHMEYLIKHGSMSELREFKKAMDEKRAQRKKEWKARRDAKKKGGGGK